jgi:hypothetical protein
MNTIRRLKILGLVLLSVAGVAPAEVLAQRYTQDEVLEARKKALERRAGGPRHGRLSADVDGFLDVAAAPWNPSRNDAA